MVLAFGRIPRGLNYSGMCACNACYKALTSTQSNKWPAGSTRSTVISDCEGLVLHSPALTGAALVQLGGGEELRSACRRLRDEHAQRGVSALDSNLMALDRGDRSGSWRLLPGVPGADVSLSNRLRLSADKSRHRLSALICNAGLGTLSVQGFIRSLAPSMGSLACGPLSAGPSFPLTMVASILELLRPQHLPS